MNLLVPTAALPYTLNMAQGQTQDESAWDSAAEYGFDMSLIEENLRKTPAQRIAAHQMALDTALSLKTAVEKQYAEDGTAAEKTD